MAKIALGYNLDELKNYVTRYSSAFFEPALDYVVMKLPKWPFDKFRSASKKLGTQMKATGEVMAIDRTFEAALLKAITCLEGGLPGINLSAFNSLEKEELLIKIKECDAERIFAIAQAIRIGVSIEEIHEVSKIDRWFLNGIKNIIDLEVELSQSKISEKILEKAETMGFTDDEILRLSKWKKSEKKKGCILSIKW